MSKASAVLTKEDLNKEMVRYLGPIFQELKGEIREVRDSNKALYQGQEVLRQEMRQGFEAIRQEMHQNVESLKQGHQVLARLIQGDKGTLNDHEGRIINLEVKMDSVQLSLKPDKK
jgi:response regulator RpfG family c-di-GMP phosphodiesterase